MKRPHINLNMHFLFRFSLARLAQHAVIAAFVVWTAACGGGGSSTTVVSGPNGGATVRAEMSLLAGSFGGPGNLDGKGESARFLDPGNSVVDTDGNLFVVDGFRIRKIAPDGMTTTLAGTTIPGRADGQGEKASFVKPLHLAIDSAGSLYVTDYGYTYLDREQSVTGTIASIRKISPEGAVTTLAGGIAAEYGKQVDGRGAQAQFASLYGIAVDGSGNAFVRDANKVRKITPDGTVSTIAEFLEGDTALRQAANHMAVDSAGTVYAANAYTIWKISPSGAVTRLFPASDPSISSFEMNGITMDRSGNLYAIRTPSYVPVGVIIRIDTVSGEVTPMTAASQALGPLDNTQFASLPSGLLQITADGQGGFYLSDSALFTVQRIGAGGVVVPLAGAARQHGNSDGVGAAATFGWGVPFGLQLAPNSSGMIYVADRINQTVRKISPAGAVSTVSNTGFLSPAGVAVDRLDNLFVSDITPPGTVSPHRSVIYRIATSGPVSLLAGTASGTGSSDGVGAQARFSNPWAMAVDQTGNVFVADSGNSTIRKISPDGTVVTIAGAAGQPGHVDGVGTSARFGWLTAMTIDTTGNLYVVDSNVIGPDNRASSVRKISPDGVVTTFVGNINQSGSADGVGANVQFNHPHGITADTAGNLYVADTGNHSIRRITPDGMVTTIAGSVSRRGIRLGKNEEISLDSPTGIAFVAPNKLVFSSGASVLKLSVD